MVRIEVNGQTVLVSGDQLVTALRATLPGFFTPGQQLSPQQSLLRSALKGALPVVLTLITHDMRQRRLQIPLPDMKSEAFRADSIGYTIDYLLTALASLVEAQTWVLEGGEHEHGYVVTGIHPAAAVVESTVATADADAVPA